MEGEKSNHTAECNLFSVIIYCYLCAGLLLDVYSFVRMLSIQSVYRSLDFPLYLLHRCCRSDETVFVPLWKRDRTQSLIKSLTLELLWLVVFLVPVSGKVFSGVALRKIK